MPVVSWAHAQDSLNCLKRCQDMLVGHNIVDHKQTYSGDKCSTETHSASI
jgi:hypothetical protein